MLIPAGFSAPELAAMLTSPSMKSVGSLGISNGFQRRRLGVTSPKGPPASCRSSLTNAGWLADG
ncbi:hypothetical protein D3C87_1648940 [compost metagenome]